MALRGRSPQRIAAALKARAAIAEHHHNGTDSLKEYSRVQWKKHEQAGCAS